jgi:uncharacterized membrane protein YdfJ with MMPL/SSD domain
VQILAKNLPLGVELCQVLALLARPTFDHGPSLADIRRSQSTFVNIRLSTINPFDATGRQWITDMRSKLARMRDYTAGKGFAVDFELVGGASDTSDAVDAVYGAFPLMIGITLLVVFVVVGSAFKSLMVPMRALVTISATLGWAYGLANLVYDDPGLWVPGDTANHNLEFIAGIGVINWFSPVMCFSILVGLGLDYDIFLLSRIYEYRKMGYSEAYSIAMGLDKTSGIISAAGIIMAIAFSGLLLSTEMLLNQCAFYLVFAVLVDTFVMEVLLVPCIMRLLGKWNWWPCKMPEPTKDIR